MKLQASDTTILTFEDVRVPVEHIIGEEGMGFTYQMIQFQVGSRIQFIRGSFGDFEMFQEERLAAAAGCLVPLSTIIEETIAYTKVWLNGGGHFEYPKYLQQKLPQLYQI